MRPSFTDYIIEIATIVAKRSTCPRLQVGAVLVSDTRIIATGYNGAVSGAAHCTDSGCMIIDGHCVRAVHAEANAITQSALYGVSTMGASMYITHKPCVSCIKLIVSAGISEVFYLFDYGDVVDYRSLGIQIPIVRV